MGRWRITDVGSFLIETAMAGHPRLVMPIGLSIIIPLGRDVAARMGWFQ